jgi:c(7)-type cytochrome triheme protein
MQVAAQGAVVVDTVRPDIERTLNRDSALAMLPRDSLGKLDWVAALRDGVVDPLDSFPGGPSSRRSAGFAFDFRIKGPDPMFDAVFAHSVHVDWLDCRSCHPGVFPYRGEPLTMEQVNNGESCGRCHGTVAFPVSACERCHPGMPGSQGEAEFLGDNTLARAEGGGDNTFPVSRFPHWVHRIRYRCSACHPSLFDMRAGTDTLTMAMLQGGQACGACHNDDVAFGMLDCARCHSPPGASG